MVIDLLKGKVLVCSEKPDQMKKIAAPFNGKHKGDHITIEPCSVFPEGAIVISACGHILKAFEPEDYDPKYKDWHLENLPIVPEEFKLKVDTTKSRYFNAFKKFINDPQISLVVNAGDPAQEGQILIDEVLYFLKNKKPVKRFWTTSLTADSVVKAFQNMKRNREYHGYYLAGLARQRADWLVGLSASRALTLLLNQKGVNKTFSAGRVQTALMGIVYQREKEIENFQSEPYWDCFGEFKFGDHTLEGQWFNEDGEHIYAHKAAQFLVKLCSNQPVTVHSVNREEKRIRPPQLYNLSSLQMAANKLYGMAPANVLSIAQSLYDKSYITYPRTDSKHLTPGEAKWLPAILANLAQIEDYKELVKEAVRDITTDKRFVDETKVSDHYALCLTEEKVNPVTLSKGEQVIYDLIAKSVIAAHYPDYVYDSSEIICSIKSRFTFKSKGSLITESGWRKVYFNAQVEPNEETLLPDLAVGQTGEVNRLELKEGKTKPPSRFTEGDLIKVMSNAAYYVKDRKSFSNKELSLGTEATRSGIITTIKKRYIDVAENKVYLLPEGRLLIEALGPDNFLSSVLMTGNMEQHLEKLKNGQGDFDDFMERTKKLTKGIVDNLIKGASDWNFDDYVKEIQEAEVLGNCRLCGEPVVDKGKFYGCTAYATTKCDFTISKIIFGKKLDKKNVINLLTKGHTSLLKGLKKKGQEQSFNGIISWNDNKKSIVVEAAK